MQLLRSVGLLIRKELILEWRQRYAISGILLFVLATVFVVFFAAVDPRREVWNALFWIIVLFASINAVVKSFVQESGHRQLYYYSLLDPVAVLLSKIIYNTLLLFVISLLAWAAFAFISENPVKETGQFVVLLFLGALGLSVTLTFTSAIAAKADNTATLLAILGLPLILPVLLSLVKLSANALRLITDTGYLTDIYMLIAIDLVLLGMGLLLFPFLWRD